MKKITFFNFSFLESGAGFEKYLIETAAYFANNFDCQVKIVTFDEKYFMYLAKLLSFYYRTKLLPIENHIHTTKQTIDSQISPAQYVKCHNFKELKEILLQSDVIYSKNELIELLILNYLNINKLPAVILGVHTTHHYPDANSLISRIHNFLYGGKLYNLLANQVKGFHVLNSSDEQYLRQQLPNKIVRKNYNPFDFDDYAKKGKILSDKYKFQQGNNITWVGRFSAQKGIDRLIRLLHNSTSIGKDIYWHIVGSGEGQEKIAKLSSDNPHIHYYGHLPNDVVPQILAQSSLFISTSYREGFPYVLLEAQAFGVPVLAYKIPGCADIIDEGVNGWLVDNEEQFAARLKDFQNQLSRDNITMHIREKFNKEKLYRDLYELIAYG